MNNFLGEKIVRKAVRSFLIEDNKVVVTKYKEGNKKAGYYEIPGGKIEEGETSSETAIREMKEETGIDISNPIYKGNMVIEYPDRIFEFDTFLVKEYLGEPQDFEENSSQWIDIKELLNKERVLANIILLDRFFIKGLIDDKYNFDMHIKVEEVDDKENIVDIKYKLIEKNI